MFQIGQEVTYGNGNKVGKFIGYDFVDGVTYIGIRWPLKLAMTGMITQHTVWYTEEEIKKYSIVLRSDKHVISRVST